MSHQSRRDFLKLAALAAASAAFGRYLPLNSTKKFFKTGEKKSNTIVLVFDAMSASHMSLYGYPRKTTPNLEKHAERATVFHTHYSAANFTVPGTSSLLTGLYPWTHRAINFSGLIARNLAPNNIFQILNDEYHTFAFSQNIWATNLLYQFSDQVDTLLPSSSFSALSMLANEGFEKDPINSFQAYDNFLFDFIDSPGSLEFGLTHRILFEWKKEQIFKGGYALQPRNYAMAFKLGDVIDNVIKTLSNLEEPYIAYVHIFSPHAPYRPRRDFIGIFDDNDWKPLRKPLHTFTEGETHETVEKYRLLYDEYIANVDYEIGRMMDAFQERNITENTHILITSDHGELLERGVKGHVTPLLYEPLVRVPLTVFSPGQKLRKDVYTPTSSVDILPTLLQLAGRDVPSWAEGLVLPELGGVGDTQRPIYFLEAKSSSSFEKLTTATFAMRKGDYKIIMYRGYKTYGKDVFELYNLKNDPEEINDLYTPNSEVALQLQKEIAEKFDAINQQRES